MVFSEQLFAIISNDNRILVNMLIYSNMAFQFQHYVKRVCAATAEELSFGIVINIYGIKLEWVTLIIAYTVSQKNKALQYCL